MDVYLDHAASTTPRPAAREAFDRWFDPDAVEGNPSSTHRHGRALREAVEIAREQMADALAASPHEIVFTSGGTEADNLAIKGLYWAGREAGRRHVVTTGVEHPAVLEAALWLAEHEGAELTLVPPRDDGTVDTDRVLDAVGPQTSVVSVMAANNELGAINDVAAIGEVLRHRGIPFHTDAVQAYATLDLDLRELQVDALSLSAHKFGGPTGVGVAYLRRGVPVTPLLHGGGQDRGVRSGTMAAALSAACGAAAVEAAKERAELRERLRSLGDRLATGLTGLDGVRRNGPDDPDRRLASHVHVSVDGIDGEALTFALDQAGVFVSTGAACGAGANKPSHVLEAAGVTGDAAVRCSLGWNSTTADVDRALEVFADTIPRLRNGVRP
ncbi:MAG: cysteine desulfurase family protein [Nitriliruptorales bacterium]|nr:cysteine desulfurase family protein [Nitriliruptorales bacterium]